LDLIKLWTKQFAHSFAQSEVRTKSEQKNRLHFLAYLWTQSEFWTERKTNTKSEVAYYTY